MYKVHVCLLVSAAKQKILFAPSDVYSPSLSWQSTSALKIDAAHFAFFGFGLMFLIPACVFFILSFAVASDSRSYFCIMFGLLRNGIPFSWSFCAASMMVVIGALKMLDACTLACCVCTIECRGC